MITSNWYPLSYSYPAETWPSWRPTACHCIGDGHGGPCAGCPCFAPKPMARLVPSNWVPDMFPTKDLGKLASWAILRELAPHMRSRLCPAYPK